MKKRIGTLDEFINESKRTSSFIIKNNEGQYLKSFEAGGISAEWTDEVDEAKTFDSADTAHNVLGYHIARSVANEATIQAIEESIQEREIIKESGMGEVDAVFQDSKDAKDFTKRMKKELPEIAKKFNDKELADFYKQLQEDSCE